MRAWILAALIACSMAVPGAAAQAPDAVQDRIEVVLDGDGGARVTHQVAGSSEDASLAFVGTPARDVQITGGIEADGDGVVIPAGSGAVTVEYALDGFVGIADGIWTLDFLYLDTVVFTVPDGAGVAFVNGQPIDTSEDKRFACHGCQLELLYMTGAPEGAHEAVWEDRTFPVGITAHGVAQNFVFDQGAKSISFEAGGGGGYVIAEFDMELLGGPYAVMHGGEMAEFDAYESGERIGIITSPDGQSEITIMGATVIPEFPALVPLAAGLAPLLAYPLMRKLSPR